MEVGGAMSDSVRHLRKFQEQMHSLHSNIERGIYSAEITCGRIGEGCICKFKDRNCEFKSQMFNKQRTKVMGVGDATIKKKSMLRLRNDDLTTTQIHPLLLTR